MPRTKTPDIQLHIGSRLKHVRLLKGLRLAELAKKVKCSESQLSKIENNKAMPSLSLLHRLGKVLGKNIPWFFTTEDEAPSIIMKDADRPVIKFENFRKTESTTIELFAPFFEGHLLQALLFIIAPGGHSLDELQHEGEELGYVLEGQFELTVDGKSNLLEAGDAFQFRSERPHGYRNPGKSITKVLWVNTPPTY